MFFTGKVVDINLYTESSNIHNTWLIFSGPREYTVFYRSNGVTFTHIRRKSM